MALFFLIFSFMQYATSAIFSWTTIGGSGIGNIVDTPAQISRVPAMSTVQNNPTLNGNSLQQFNRLSQFNNGVFQPNPFMQSIYRDWQLNNNSF